MYPDHRHGASSRSPTLKSGARRSLVLCLAVLAFTPGVLAGQDRARIVVQVGILSPDRFGEIPVVIDFFEPPEEPSRVTRAAENGPALSLGVVVPYLGDLSIEAGWDFSVFDTGEILEIGGEEGSLREDAEHHVHVYRAGLRYAVPLSDRVRPHLSAALGGITTLSEYDLPRGSNGRKASETQWAAVLGAGATIPVRPRVALRFDVRDLLQFCSAEEPPCEEDGPRHHLGFFGGVEIGL